MTAKALRLNIPLSVQLDLTYRCNERCVHCYLDHDDHGEMTTAEIKHLLDEMAEAGVFILTLSGGEIFLRKDFFELLEHARRLMFCVKLKTNAVLIREREAARLRDLDIESIQISIYSHRPEVHDAITLVPGSLKRSVDAIRFLKSQGLKVIIANVLMTQNMQDYPGVRALAAELGVECTLDPTVTPMMDGDRAVLEPGRRPERASPGVPRSVAGGRRRRILRNPRPSRRRRARTRLLAAPDTPPATFRPMAMFSPACSFRFPRETCGSSGFVDIWRHSDQMNDVRSIRLKDLPTCTSCSHVGSCTRCPGLAYMEGNMRGPSTQDCEKSFARTGVPSANMLAKKQSSANLVQIRALPTDATVPASAAIA